MFQEESYLRGMEDSLATFSGGDAATATQEPVLREGTNTAKARDAIRAAGKPLHISKLLEAIGLENTKATRAALAGSIAAYARKNQIFTRPHPNTFGLAELCPADSGGEAETQHDSDGDDEFPDLVPASEIPT